MISDNIIYIDSLYNDASITSGLVYYGSSNMQNIISKISKDIKNAINKSNDINPTPTYDGDNLLYFTKNKEILLNDQTNFRDFKNIITSYISYIYYYIFFIVFIIFIILHYIYINTNNQTYSYILIAFLVIYIIYVAYNIYFNSIN